MVYEIPFDLTLTPVAFFALLKRIFCAVVKEYTFRLLRPAAAVKNEVCEDSRD